MALNRPQHRAGYGQRLALAIGVAVGALALVALLGPTPEQVDEWLAHTGAEGELRILPEINLMDENSIVTQERQEAMTGATRGVETEVLPEERTEESVEPVPAPQVRGNPDARSVTEADHWATGLFDETQVEVQEMSRPSQLSLDFVLEHVVRPVYPADAPEHLQATRIVVVVAIYVDETGKAAEILISSNNGGPLFAEAVKQALLQWRYRRVVFDREPQGFWDKFEITFPPRLRTRTFFPVGESRNGR